MMESCSGPLCGSRDRLIFILQKKRGKMDSESFKGNKTLLISSDKQDDGRGGGEVDRPCPLVSKLSFPEHYQNRLGSNNKRLNLIDIYEFGW